MVIYTPPSVAKDIPVIDLAESFSHDIEKRKAVAWEIHKAARQTGFFYIKNHGVPVELQKAYFDLAKEYFASPMDEKMQISSKNSVYLRGYEPIAAQTLDEGSPPDLKEGFLLGRDLTESHPYVKNKTPYHGPNQWPEGNPHFRQQAEDYMRHMELLGRKLVRLLALSLELPEDFFDEGLKEPMIISRMLYYPSQPKDAQVNQLGAGAHTDWGLITLLLQDAVGGLEVRNVDGEWLKAPCIENTFVVNLGDMVPVLTNGLYHSTMHRVLNAWKETPRYSFPTFFDLDYYYEASVVPTLRKPDEEYPEPITVGGHIAEMFNKTFGVK
ncbi:MULTISPECIES: isopenicillin N synthase family dioxygenase [Klebsiella pneumoniae complex]|nr:MULTISPECIES: 2-oxoglutarate and iron-dependent oxygenase domain-containing protein [Klebsiella]MAS23964.1 isopenicillin N synthase family oxygenase [Oceanospirillaceae bacterium]HCU0657999.1 isopenicillin N synthase family oxygenase [Klebsiella quasipneumoniae]EJD6546897.1 isopenicillin N synthase family oxygenase [Klebsiella pneumoniae]EKX3321388.1 isopenicillin N synthase family oxygenase [Klebsiella pneumoniae]ELA0504763.1 isopenicillin N synthase family oxygenase [Klebsiella pneumoniae|tara:strand:- start:260 stop:1237 length:978 start_codon:yes stop_codon:yes gene_type:complete